MLLLLLLAALPARAAIDPFYQSLLRDGQAAYDRKDYADASRVLRLACFGMLDEPRHLADCLARLALAQDRVNDLDGFRDTFQRLVEIEERFQAYSRGDLAPSLRAALEQRLAARLPAATLAGAPAFRSTLPVKSAATTAGKTPPQKSPPRSQEAAKPGTPRSAAPAGKAPAAADPAVKPLTEAERAKLEQARQVFAGRRTSRELREAYELAREVADAHPELKEAQHLAAEGAYRISRWSDAAAYFRRGGDPGDGEPERLFYMAVAFYETGDRAGAAAALKRALPSLKRTPYVDAYAKKILGQ